jgi:hypothetical protein
MRKLPIHYFTAPIGSLSVSTISFLNSSTQNLNDQMVRLPETFQLSASESESHPKWDQFRELAEEFVQNDCTRILRAMEMEEFSEPDDKGCEVTLNMDLAFLSSTKRNY